MVFPLFFLDQSTHANPLKLWFKNPENKPECCSSVGYLVMHSLLKDLFLLRMVWAKKIEFQHFKTRSKIL
jgi:hypothetical protein